ncbi:MAG: hypothetical protein AB7N91_30905 [Candidatus Tectimicrobiota bacterium]
MRVLVAEHTTPVRDALGRLIAYRIDRDYVERPGTTPPGAQHRPVPGRVQTCTRVPQRPRIESFPAPDTLARVVALQAQRRGAVRLSEAVPPCPGCGRECACTESPSVYGGCATCGRRCSCAATVSPGNLTPPVDMLGRIVRRQYERGQR